MEKKVLNVTLDCQSVIINDNGERGVTITDISNIIVCFATNDKKVKEYTLFLNEYEQLEIRESLGHEINVVPKCSNVIALK